MFPLSSKKGPGKKIFLVVCLALVCVASAELLVCRFAAPDLFQRITAPVVAAAERIRSAGSALLESAVQHIPTPAEQEEAPEEQLAGDPALENTQPMEDPAITEFVQRNGHEVLTGGNVEIVYFNQGEEPWASAPYGPDNIGGYGCGPTAMAMVVSSLTSQMVDPSTMAQWAYESGYCAPGSGSYNSLIQAAASAYGLKAAPWTALTADALSQALASGQLFVALMTRGHFTSSGHFILLRGLTLEGKILVADPNSRERSLTAWDPQLIIDELSATRSSGAPLWCISTVDTIS
ncbi:C39 family peptidase [Intestinimonas sp. HCP28S3_D6]|uniref:C39 family peptidase n=1 Tax=Intestinimonas sp. HCP28S3_D6 TaxID=3438942 RepID=UPI003F89ED78